MLVAPVGAQDTQVTITGDDARHLVVVMRTEAGAPLSVADGSGSLWQGEVVEATPSAVDVRLTQRWEVEPPTPRLVVVHGLPKGRKLDDVVRMLSEIGVDRLIPVRTSRSDVRPSGPRAHKAVERWRAVAHAAAKQSRRVRPLVVDEIADWPGLAPGARGAVLWEEATVPLGEVLADADDDAAELVLMIGAEGGLTRGEVEAAGLVPAGLGPGILRTETAAVVAASIALHRSGRLG